ncbi:Ca2+-transporting ATPase [Asanoa hainanensis]|uniref:Ca2+-transporting ATPase n=1 Tax=Asanoa hainanensis TaxID=560556 RepID=A0A239P177_9ACTN|nr:HAD-IC family P-type ATPase [Asanoa hainanensis]SNT60835.1 Ca2+-transporting ATPase [Asanoa hainanensis]
MLTISVPATDVAPPGGITEEAAGRHLRDEGPNLLDAAPAHRLSTRVARQLTDPLVVLLIAAAVVTAVLGDYPDTAVIALVVIVNTGIGVWQEVRADRAIAALDGLAAPTARVVRDGVDRIVPVSEVVRGDRALLAAGDIVPADIALDGTYRLRLDESAMTGEAQPVDREAGQEVSAGTVVVAGRGAGTVVRIGSASALGRIVGLVRGTRPGPTPLQRRLARLGRVLGVAVLLMSAVVFVLGLLTGRGTVEMAVTAVSLVVAAVPESMPAVVTLALALGARRMARAKAIPRRLRSVETLGSVTVIAADKTGTLTEGRMAVQEAVTSDGGYVIHGHGYTPEGHVSKDGKIVVPDTDLGPDHHLERRLRPAHREHS